MNQNMGTTDRIIRIAVAFCIGVLYYVGAISGLVAIVLSIFAIIFLATSFVAVCPLYLPFGISTKKNK